MLSRLSPLLYVPKPKNLYVTSCSFLKRLEPCSAAIKLFSCRCHYTPNTEGGASLPLLCACFSSLGDFAIWPSDKGFCPWTQLWAWPRPSRRFASDKFLGFDTCFTMTVCAVCSTIVFSGTLQLNCKFPIGLLSLHVVYVYLSVIQVYCDKTTANRITRFSRQSSYWS